MQKWLDEEQQVLLSYHPKSYLDLKHFTEVVPLLYSGVNSIPDSVQAFLDTIDFEENLINIKKNSKTAIHFSEIFFKWFNAFKVLKYMHFSRDNYYGDISVSEAANELLVLINEEKQISTLNLLKKFRKLDK